MVGGFRMGNCELVDANDGRKVVGECERRRHNMGGDLTPQSNLDWIDPGILVHRGLHESFCSPH